MALLKHAAWLCRELQLGVLPFLHLPLGWRGQEVVGGLHPFLASVPRGPLTCSPAHCSPLQPHLAVGSNDYYMSVYSVEKRVR